MPTIQIDGVGPIQFPDNMSEAQIVQAIERDILPQQRRQQPQVAPTEGGGGIFGSTVGSLVSGAGGVLSGVGALGGMALPGVGFDNVLTRAGRGVQEYGESFMSPELRAKRQALTEAIKQAESEGLVAEARAALSTILSNPSLLASMALEQIPQFVASGGVGRIAMGVASTAARRGATALGAEAAEVAAREAGRRAALGSAIGTGAGLQAGDVSNQAYQDVMNLPDATLANSPAYRELLTTMDPRQARVRLAERAGTEAGVMGGAISAGTMAFLPGAEKLMFGKELSRRAVTRILGGAAGEAVQEAIEEGGGQIAQNIAVSRADTERNLLAGAGGAAAVGGALGGIMGGGIAGLRGGPRQEQSDRESLPLGLRQAINEYVANREPVAGELLIPGREATIETPIGEMTRTQFVRVMEQRLPDMMDADPTLASRISYAQNEDERVRVFQDALEQNRDLIIQGRQQREVTRFEQEEAAAETRAKIAQAEQQISVFNDALASAEVRLDQIQSAPRVDNVALQAVQDEIQQINTAIAGRQRIVEDLTASLSRTEDQAPPVISETAPKTEQELAREAFEIARARQERSRQRVEAPGLEIPSGARVPDTIPAQREDLRAGAPEITEQRYVLNPEYQNGRLVGGEDVVQIGEADNFGNVLAYVQRRRGDIVETVPVETTMDKLAAIPVRETARMTQDVSSQLAGPPRGVDVEGQTFEPRRAVDRTGGPEFSARAVSAQADQGKPTTTSLDDARRARRVAAQDKLNKLYLNKLKDGGQSGRLLRNALVNALKDNTLNADQVYAAFIAADVLGPLIPTKANHRIQFVSRIFAGQDADQALAESGGVRDQEVQGFRIRPDQPGLMGLIQISLSPTQSRLLRESTAHEAFHVLQDYFAKYDPKFAEAMRTGFKPTMNIKDVDPSIRRKLQSIKSPTSNRSYWDELTASLPNDVSGREAQAYVFASLYDAKKRGVPMTGLKPAMTRFMNMVSNFFSRFGNALRGNGYKNVADIFESVTPERVKKFADVEAPTQQEFGKGRLSELSARQGEVLTDGRGLAPTDERTIEFSARQANMSVPEFKTWWEGGWRGEGYTPTQSVARTQNGQPIEFYHGTLKKFAKFGKAKSGAGSYDEEGPFYFSPSADFASEYVRNLEDSKVIPVYLSIQKPFDSTIKSNQDELLAYIDRNLDDGKISWRDINVFPETEADARKSEFEVTSRKYRLFKSLLGAEGSDNWRSMETRAAQRFLRDRGYDSFYVLENGVKNIAVFDPRQIKSVFNKFEQGAATAPEFAARRVAAEPVLLRDIDQLVKDAQSQENWRDWYTRHEATINDLFGDDAPLFRKILSATSQASSVPSNVALAIKAYKQMLSGDKFTGYLPAVIRNLERIRTDEGLRGQKISQYGQAVTADEAEAAKGVAVDRHIARLLFGVDRPTARQVAIATDIINQISDRLGWEPRQVQAALWAFNQVKEGVDPKNVKSYDTYLARKAEEIRQFRSSFSGAEGRGLRPSPPVAQRAGETQAPGQVEFAARRTTLSQDPNYQMYTEALTSEGIPKSGLFSSVFRRFVGAMESTALYGTPDTPEKLRDALVRTSVNRAYPIWLLQRLADKMGVLNGRDIGIAAETALMNTGRMQILTELGMVKVDPVSGDLDVRDDIKPLLEILRDKIDSKNQNYFQTYAIALRERDLRRAGKSGMKSFNGQPFTNQDIDNIIRTAEQQNPEFKDVAEDLKKFSDGLLDFAVDSGIMTRAKAQELGLMFYTPFYRLMEEDAQTDPGSTLGPQMAGGLRNVTSALDKSIKGGDGRIGDLIENILKNADSIIRAGLKNNAIRMTAEVARDVGLGKVVKTKGPNVVTYRVNGNEVNFLVEDPLLFTAMATAPAKTRGALFNAMARMTGFFRDMITMAPSFIWASLYRGKIQAYAQEGASLSPFTTIKGYRDALNGSTSFKSFTAQTGFGGMTYGMGERDFAKKIKRVLDDRGIFGELARGNVFDPFKRAFNFLSRMSEGAELAERLALYEKLKAAGVSDRQAAFQAYNLAPFSRRGSGDGVFGGIVQTLIPLVPFLNAKIQGLYRLVENEKGAPTIFKIPQQIFLRSLMITAFSTAIYALNALGGHDDELKGLTVDEIMRYDTIFIGDGKRIVLPRNYEIGSFFGAIPVLALEAYRRENKDDLVKAALSIGTSTLFFNPIPQAALPLISATTNYDFFRNRELENAAMRSRPPEERIDRATSELAKWASMATGNNVSPIRMQAVLSGYTGSIGTGLMAGFDTLLGSLGLIPNKPSGPLGSPDSAASIAAGLSGLGRFYRTEETSPTRFVGDFYKVKELSDQLNNSIRDARVMGDFEKIMDRQMEKGPLISMRSTINGAATQMSDLNKQIRMFEQANLDSDTKLAMIAPLRRQRDFIARSVVEQARMLGAI
jgi:hypothetical protein